MKGGIALAKFTDLSEEIMIGSLESGSLTIGEVRVYVDAHTISGEKLAELLSEIESCFPGGLGTPIYKKDAHGVFASLDEKNFIADLTPYVPEDLTVIYFLRTSAEIQDGDFEYRGGEADEVAKIYLRKKAMVPREDAWVYNIIARTPVLRARQECFDLLQRLVLRQIDVIGKK